MNLCRNLYEFVCIAQLYICPPTGPQRIKVIIVWTQMACMDGQLTLHQHWKKALRKMGGSIKTPSRCIFITKNVQGQTCEVQFFRNNVHTGKLWPINPTSPAGKNASGQLGLPPTAAPVIDMPGAQPDMSQNPNKSTAQRQQAGQTGQAGRLNKKQSKLKLAFSEIKLRRQELNDNHFFSMLPFFLKRNLP